jgi:apolipoprotein N-acyltransferase
LTGTGLREWVAAARPGRREVLAGVSGILLALSFPKFGHGALAWVALAPLLMALPGASSARSIRLGYITGAVSALGLLYWTSFVVVQYGGLSLPVGITVMVLLCLAVALFPALFAWMVAGFLHAYGLRGLLLAPVAWVATEMVRSYTFFRFPWCLLGYSQQENLPFIQIAAVTAVYGVSFLLVATSALLAYAAHATDSRSRRRALLALPALVGAVFLHGIAALYRPVPVSGTVRVGLVQASIAQDEKWDPQNAAANFAKHVNLSHQAAQKGARLVVWPESAVPYRYDDSPGLAAALRQLTADLGIHLLFGNDDRRKGAEGDRVWVGAKLLDPAGELRLRYHKIRLVPFGEYVPLGPVITLGGRVTAKLVQQVADFTPGTEATTAEVDGHRVGAFICYEAIFPDLVRRFSANQAELLVNITNDAWYGRTSAPHQHLAMAAFRAVENGKYLVRAANTGTSAVVDPKGRVLERTPLFEPTVIVRDVPFVAEKTFYARFGDVFGGAAFLAALLLTVQSRFRRRA